MIESPPFPTSVDVWIFDLDNTLYPASSNLFPQIERRMGAFIAETFGLDADAARARQKAYFRRHGTTLRGLMVEDGIAPDAFLAYVHDIDLAAIAADPVLDRALGRLPGRKLIFTNGSRAHAEGVCARLGVRRHFEAIFDIAAASYIPKPDPEAYRTLLACHGIDPRGACMVEDMARNLVPAAALGMRTVWVRTPAEWGAPVGDEASSVHWTIDGLTAWLDAGTAVPEPAATVMAATDAMAKVAP